MTEWHAAAAITLTLATLGIAQSEETTRLVLPEVRVLPNVVRRGDPIPITLTIRNNLNTTLLKCTKSLVPTDRNGEIWGISLQAVYRDRKPDPEPVDVTGHPRLNYPLMENAFPCHRIAPGGDLTIKSDLRKWTVKGGWQAGKYTASMRIEGLTPAGDSLTVISAISDLFEFEVQ
jgi:hypothetical protein